jgi:hypothetical protein
MNVENAIKRIEDCIRINHLEDPRSLLNGDKKISKEKIVVRTLFNVLDDLKKEG